MKGGQYFWLTCLKQKLHNFFVLLVAPHRSFSDSKIPKFNHIPNTENQGPVSRFVNETNFKSLYHILLKRKFYFTANMATFVVSFIFHMNADLCSSKWRCHSICSEFSIFIKKQLWLKNLCSPTKPPSTNPNHLIITSTNLITEEPINAKRNYIYTPEQIHENTISVPSKLNLDANWKYCPPTFAIYFALFLLHLLFILQKKILTKFLSVKELFWGSFRA